MNVKRVGKVQQHQKGSVTLERAPFRRQLDFWAFAIATAIAKDIAPLEPPINIGGKPKWGTKFVDTRAVEMSNDLCELLAVVVLTKLGVEHEGIDDPAQIIDLANCLAGAGSPVLLKELIDPSLRMTPLEKALEFARAMRSEILTPTG